MNDKKRGGCSALVVVLIIGLLFLGLIASAVFWLVGSRVAHRERETAEQRRTEADAVAFASHSGDQQETVKLSADAYRRYSPTDFGGGLSREHFAALMADQNATELARETFTTNANGQTVRWLLKTTEVRETDGSGLLVADFSLPYHIQTSPGSWAGSALSIRAEFPATERERLVTIRRNDWVTVEGRLELKGQAIKLLDARIPLPANAERPAD